MKKFISGFLAGALIFGAIGAAAVTYVANPVDFKVLVNGNEFVSDPPALEVEGRTYLPLRAMGDALGVPVNWNEELRQAEVGNSASVAQSGEYSRQNPAPINTVQKISIDNYSEKYDAAVRVMEVKRGEEALTALKSANQFNSDPKEGYEYILAKVAFSVLAVDGDTAVTGIEYDFNIFSGNNEKYDSIFRVTPEPRLADQLFAGGNTEGYMVFEVKKDDANPKIVYGQKYDGSGGIWFLLQ